MFQKTIKKTISCSGIGLHSGRKVGLTLRPAAVDTGILFSIKNGDGHRFVKPRPESVNSTSLATTVSQGKDRVATVEHILAAVRGMGVDNLLIEVDGGEVPIMDGSAAPFVYLLRMAGVRPQSKPVSVLAVTRPVEFKQDGKWIKAEPYSGFAVDYAIDFSHPLIGRQEMSLTLTPESFAAKVAKARTFGFLSDVEMLKKNGLALGGSLESAVVLDEFGVVNEDGLRYKDEFVRHKLLDFIGDMALAGAPLWGRFDVFASGHALNNAFLRHLTGNAHRYLERVELSRPDYVGGRVAAGEMARELPSPA